LSQQRRKGRAYSQVVPGGLGSVLIAGRVATIQIRARLADLNVASQLAANRTSRNAMGEAAERARSEVKRRAAYNRIPDTMNFEPAQDNQALL
jgi:hypothetical protein